MRAPLACCSCRKLTANRHNALGSVLGQGICIMSSIIAAVTDNDRQITLLRELRYCIGTMATIMQVCTRPTIPRSIDPTREYRASLGPGPRAPLTSSVSTSSHPNHQRRGTASMVSDRIIQYRSPFRLAGLFLRRK